MFYIIGKYFMILKGKPKNNWNANNGSILILDSIHKSVEKSVYYDWSFFIINKWYYLL